MLLPRAMIQKPCHGSHFRTAFSCFRWRDLSKIWSEPDLGPILSKIVTRILVCPTPEDTYTGGIPQWSFPRLEILNHLRRDKSRSRSAVNIEFMTIDIGSVRSRKVCFGPLKDRQVLSIAVRLPRWSDAHVAIWHSRTACNRVYRTGAATLIFLEFPPIHLFKSPLSGPKAWRACSALRLIVAGVRACARLKPIFRCEAASRRG
jgi:hypothetical protein